MNHVARKLITTLRYLHSNGWVHGDVSPDNILLGPDGDLALVDWEFARKIGDPAAAGTLGYAPTMAWKPGYSAAPQNDVYGAAVVLWELASGRRAFPSDAASARAAQEHFSFDGIESASTAMNRLFRAARERRHLRWDDVASLDVEPLFDAERVASLVVRPIVERVERQVMTALERGQIHHCAELREPPSTVAHIGDEVARQLTESWVGEVHRFGQLLLALQCDKRLKTAGASEPDALRAQLSMQVSRCADVLTCSDKPPLVVATEAEVAGSARVVWRELIRRLSRVGNGPRFVELRRSEPEASSRTGCNASALRSGLAVALGGAHVSSGAIDTCVGAGEDLVVALNAARRLLESGVLRQTEQGVLAVDGRVARPVVAFSRETRDESAIDPLEAGEECAVLGDARAAAELCREAEEALAKATPIARRIRCSDLWADLDRWEDCERVLTEPHQGNSMEVLWRLARAQACQGKLDALLEVVEQMESVECEDGYHEVLRWRAAYLTGVRQYEDAYQNLRSALRRVSRGSGKHDWARLAILSMLGNLLRRRGREHSAARVLRCAERLAETFGAVRLRIALSANVILAAGAREHPLALAKKWLALRDAAFGWGLPALGFQNGVRQARALLSAGQSDAAAEAVGQLTRLVGGDLGIQREWRDAFAEIAAYCQDARGLACLGDGFTRPGEPPSVRLLRLLQRHELGLASNAELLHDVRGLRILEARVLRIGLRAAQRPGALRFSLCSAAEVLDDAFVDGSPLRTHVLRVLLRAHRSEIVSEFVKAAKSQPSTWLAAVALCGAWGRAPASATATDFTERLANADSQRPAGIRVWEWRLAYARCSIRIGAWETGLPLLDTVVEPLKGQLRGLDESSRAAYEANLPLHALWSLAGLGGRGDGEPLEVGRLESAYASIVTAHHRNAGSSTESAGLARVLACARRLNAARSLDALLVDVVTGLLEVCRADRAVVLYESSDSTTRAKVATQAGIANLDPRSAEISSSALNVVRSEGRARVFEDAMEHAALGARPSVKRYRPRSLMIAPLKTEDRDLGFLYVESRTRPRLFAEADKTLIEAFAAQAALSIENGQLIAELRASLRETARARGEAVRAENLRVLGQQASEVAHDFNNLLATIVGESELLLEESGLVGARRGLRVIRQAARDGAAAVRRLQDSTRVRSCEDMEVVDLGALARDVLEFTRVHWASRTSAPVDAECVGNAGVFVHGVPGELREIVTNLILNAVDAMPCGGRVAVEVESGGGEAVLRVTDSGVGVPPEAVERIFEAFFTTKGEAGNGLGLSISLGIVERHGGRLECEPRRGAQGTVMTMVLPAVRVPPGRRGDAGTACAQPAPSAGVETSLGTALVIDDEPHVAGVLGRMLERLGYCVEIVHGGEEAIAKLATPQSQVDLVFTDLCMPGVTGIEVAQAARRVYPQAHIVLTTGLGTSPITCSEYADAVLSKPFSLGDVRASVELTQ